VFADVAGLGNGVTWAIVVDDGAALVLASWLPRDQTVL
jgi:hypothetical protein